MMPYTRGYNNDGGLMFIVIGACKCGRTLTPVVAVASGFPGCCLFVGTSTVVRAFLLLSAVLSALVAVSEILAVGKVVGGPFLSSALGGLVYHCLCCACGLSALSCCARRGSDIGRGFWPSGASGRTPRG